MRTITYEETVEALRALPADGTNPGCVYTYEDEVQVLHCAVGQALVDLNVPVPNEKSRKIKPDSGFAKIHPNSDVVDDLVHVGWFRRRGVRFDPKAVRVLARVQEILDNDDSNTTLWGDAVDHVLGSV